MKTLLFWLCTLATISMTAQAECNNFYPRISPDGNNIFFSSSQGDGVYSIFRTDINGESLSQITNSFESDVFPSISPDGQKIVFQRGAYGSGAEIFIMNADGSDQTQLTNNSLYDGYPSFSPDGTQIIFDAWDGSDYPEIFTMNIDGTNRTQLTNEGGAYWQSAPIFTPDGTRIYFKAGINANNHYVSMDLNGNDWVNITPENEFGYDDYELHFTSDGQKIVFSTTEFVQPSAGCDIILADADGSNWQQLTASASDEYSYGPFIDPTDTWIYFTLKDGPVWDITRIDMDGNNQQLIYSCTNTSIEEIDEENTLFLYPNPASSWVQIETNLTLDENFEFILRDGQARIIKADVRRTSVGNFVLDVSNLQTGIYFISVHNGKDVLRKTLTVIDK